jgi:SAM-dependent methyltransferase
MQTIPLRSGIPSLIDVEAMLDGPLYKGMSDFSRAFLKTNQSALRRYGWSWTADPLQNWSRRWEYCYVARQVAAFSERRSGDRIEVLDAGSGVTFFPYYLSEKLPEAHVTCCDNNPAYQKIFAKINESFDHPPVNFISAALQELPLASDSLDAIYCISVLEHTDNYGAILREFRRVLRPGGLLLITFDISLDDASCITRTEAERLLKMIDEQFVVDPELDCLAELKRVDRPDEILTTDRVRRSNPELLPWKYPLLKAAYDLLKGRGWTGGFYSLSCYCLAASIEA